MRAVIQHVSGQRQEMLDGLLSVFPSASVVECGGDPMETFCRAMRATEGGALFFEDDAILANGFLAKSDPLCGENIVTFFRRDVAPDGVRFLPGSKWLCNVGFWVPPGVGKAIADYAKIWPRRLQHPTGFDLLVRDWLVSQRYRFGAVYPSLVQHAVGPSLLGPRARDRRSPTWQP